MTLSWPLAAALRWHGAERKRPLLVRIALAALIVIVAFVVRVVATSDPLGAGRDLLLLGVLVAALLFGLVPGLCAALLARALSIWWYVGPNGEALVPPWHVPGIALFLAAAVLAAALAGQTLQLLVSPEEEDAPALAVVGASPEGETALLRSSQPAADATSR
ncbi:hypothetical protein ACLF3G_20810 [Falsiroseomonas sp. HC035]|uniref:hypothetical protein n=1 Tax=Falsiroseomonas sp. HC035 TaxID=3390999 RepID=UPI003D30F03D